MGIEALQFVLSGGSSNTDPLLSIGGAKSSTEILSQTVSGSVAIPGVTLVDSRGNTAGSGSLFYQASDKTLRWMPPGDTSYGLGVSVNANGTYFIRGTGTNAGYVVVTVVSVSLSGATDYTSTVTVAGRTQLLFNDVSKDESYAGQTDYRCVYLYNSGAASIKSVVVTLVADTPGLDTLAVGKVAAAINTNETAPANRFTAPSSVTFSAATVPVTIGDIPAGQFWGFWVRRTVPATTVDGTISDTFKIKVSALV